MVGIGGAAAVASGYKFTVAAGLLSVLVLTHGIGLCGNQPVCRVLGDDVAALVPSSGEEPASPRYRAGVASMAWRSTRERAVKC